MDRFQRMSLVSLTVVVILAVALSVKSFGARLRAPFHLIPAQESSAPSDADRLLRLKVSDTDKDTLSDYDEVYQYHTSPYIPDSDSDGYLDGEEVQTGNDPNCPKGTVCTAGISAVQPDVADVVIPSGTTGATNSGAIDPYSVSDPATIRQMILSTGAVTPAQLAEVDDATLLATWEQVKQTAIKANSGSTDSAPNPATAPVAPSTGSTPAKLPINPPVAQVRQLLESSGIDPSILKSVDDATLLRLYEQTRLEQEAKDQAKNP